MRVRDHQEYVGRMKRYRKKIVAGNWKMNKSTADAEVLASDLCRDLANFRDVDVVLCPPYTSLQAVGRAIENTLVRLGAQNMHWENSGAFTGEISAAMLRDLYCHYVILGHSERRQLFQETDHDVNTKVKAALAATLNPIMCVGETLEERESGKTEDVITRQVETGLQDIGNNLGGLIVAYEPVWAIGTGKTATPEQAQDVHHFIRELLQKQFGEAKAGATRIQYGGSVKPDNAKALMSQPDIDGGLIGGASLETRAFVEIVKSAVPEEIPDYQEDDAPPVPG